MSRIPLYFDFSEFLITDLIEPSAIISQNILEYIHFLNPIRHESGVPMIVSKRSGYRPKWWEKQKKRSGKSQHTTFTIPHRGAVDLVYQWDQFKMVFDAPFFTRICYYPHENFYHCDRKPTDGKRLYFECKNPSDGWQFISNR